MSLFSWNTSVFLLGSSLGAASAFPGKPPRGSGEVLLLSIWKLEIFPSLEKSAPGMSHRGHPTLRLSHRTAGICPPGSIPPSPPSQKDLQGQGSWELVFPTSLSQFPLCSPNGSQRVMTRPRSPLVASASATPWKGSGFGQPPWRSLELWGTSHMWSRREHPSRHDGLGCVVSVMLRCEAYPLIQSLNRSSRSLGFAPEHFSPWISRKAVSELLNSRQWQKPCYVP